MSFRQSNIGKFLKTLPIAICGLTLGLGGLGNMVGMYSGVLRSGYLAMAVFLWIALLLKLVLFWAQAKEEFQNPLTMSVFEAFFMTMLQFVGVATEVSSILGMLLWTLATIGHIVLVILFSYRFLRNFQLGNVFTTWNVLYGGNMLAAVMSPYLHVEGIARIVFWVGVILFLPWYPISMYRYYKMPVEEAVKPTLCILAAPFNLTLAGYLSCMSHPDLRIAGLLFAIAQTMYLYVLMHLPGILKLPFYPSYGALTFPMVIPAVAFQKMLEYLSGIGIGYPGELAYILLAERVIAVVMVTYALIRYLQFLAGKLIMNKKAHPCG